MNKNTIVLLIFCFIGFIALILLDIVYQKITKESNIYINEIHLELNEKIISKKRINNTCFLFKTDKGNAFMIDQMTQNKIYESFREYVLFDLLNVNDSISKKNNNDTLYVYQQGKEYYFVIGKMIN